MPSMNRSMSVPDTGSMWDMHTSASQPPGTFSTSSYSAVFTLLSGDSRVLSMIFVLLLLGSEASLWDITMNPSTQGPTLEQLQKVSSVPHL